MKISKRQLKRIIKEEYSKLKRQGLIRESMNQYSVTEIYMDIMRKGGPDRFCAIAHERPGMKCSDFMHYEHALRAYIDTEAPHLLDMPNNIYSQIVELLRETV